MKLNTVITLLLACLVGVLGTLLAVSSQRQPGAPRGIAWAQESAQVGYIIGLIGPMDRFRVPIVLVDTQRQVLMVYEYNSAQTSLRFVQARTYRYDRQLGDFPPNSSTPTVKEIEDYVDRITRGAPR
jgi:hypothetical protein